MREDYSADGDAWRYLSHEQARSRAYRWGEDGLLGLCDRQGRLCFAPALWNGVDPILKERLFGLTGPEGNHGEDVKELYYYLDATPTHSYGRALYRYPQRAFPYAQLVAENGRRTRDDREFEITDTGAFDEGRYFDVTVEHAKAAPDDLCLALSVANRGPEAAPLVVLPTLWFRNTWCWGREGEGYLPPEQRPWMAAVSATEVDVAHPTLGRFRFAVEPLGDAVPELIFTENETNAERLFGAPNRSAFCKDAFHAYVVRGDAEAVNPSRWGTKMAAVHALVIPAGRRGAAAHAPDRGQRRERRGAARALRRLRVGDDGAAQRGGRLLRREDRAAEPGRAHGGATGLRRAAVVAPAVRVRRAHLAGRRPVAAGAAARAARRAKRRLDASLQPRRHLDAGQVGVPLVRVVGPGVPHAAVRAHRPGVRDWTS